MSGHSKWSTIKRKKGAEDAKRGQIFTKLSKEISSAARQGGGDPEANFRLRLAMDKAKQANMPKENIERAIKRGTGESKGGEFERLTYEGYGPQGSAILMDVLTDNRNRAVADIRREFRRHSGNLGESGCVAWMFQQKGLLIVEVSGDPEEFALEALDLGAEDVEIGGTQVEVYAAPEDFERVREALKKRGDELVSAELTMIPSTYLPLDPKGAIQTMHLADALEELDDVQQVYTNVDISDEVIAQYESEAV